MSRIEYTDEEDFPGQFHLWQANCARSLEGRAGQASLRELEAALVALPTKRLIANELDNGADCCAIGAVVRHKGITPKTRYPEENMESVGVECGMPRMVAWKIVEWNDLDTDGCTPEQRYDRILRYVRELLRRGATS